MSAQSKFISKLSNHFFVIFVIWTASSCIILSYNFYVENFTVAIMEILHKMMNHWQEK